MSCELFLGMFLGYGNRVAKSWKCLETGFGMKEAIGLRLNQCCHRQEAQKTHSDD